MKGKEKGGRMDPERLEDASTAPFLSMRQKVALGISAYLMACCVISLGMMPGLTRTWDMMAQANLTAPDALAEEERQQLQEGAGGTSQQNQETEETSEIQQGPELPEEGAGQGETQPGGTVEQLAGPSVSLRGEERMGLEVKWVYNTSAAFPGLTFGAGHQGTFTVYDIDSDGRTEILFGTRRGSSKRIWCLEQGESGEPRLEWVYPDIAVEGLPGDPTTKPSLVDVDNDGAYEICIAGRGSKLSVLRPDGTLLWTWSNPIVGEGSTQAMHGAPQAFDVDGDGFVEFFLNDNYGFVHRVSHEGHLVWASVQAGASNPGHPTVCDIDRDGECEILFASQDHNLYCLKASTGEEKWRFDTGANMPTNQVFVLDVNRDGEYEAISWTDASADPEKDFEPIGGRVLVLSQFGAEISSWTMPYEGAGIRLCQALGDVDEDGSMEMALMTGANIFVIDVGRASPATEWEINLTHLSEEGILPDGALTDQWSSYQLIADIDGDMEQEILWLSPFPIVTDARTGAVEGYYVNDQIAVSRRQEDGGWWGDVDGDGISEWICDLNGPSHRESMIYCLTMNGRFPADTWWPEYYHSALPRDDQEAAGWLLLKAAYSNGLFFPANEALLLLLALVGAIWARRSRDP